MRKEVIHSDGMGILIAIVEIKTCFSYWIKAVSELNQGKLPWHTVSEVVSDVGGFSCEKRFITRRLMREKGRF